jgi:hypothetical protein
MRCVGDGRAQPLDYCWAVDARRQSEPEKATGPVLGTAVRPTGGGATSLSAANNDDNPSCRANTSGSACQ